MNQYTLLILGKKSEKSLSFAVKIRLLENFKTEICAGREFDGFLS